MCSESSSSICPTRIHLLTSSPSSYQSHAPMTSPSNNLGKCRSSIRRQRTVKCPLWSVLFGHHLPAVLGEWMASITGLRMPNASITKSLIGKTTKANSFEASCADYADGAAIRRFTFAQNVKHHYASARASETSTRLNAFPRNKLQ